MCFSLTLNTNFDTILWCVILTHTHVCCFPIRPPQFRLAFQIGTNKSNAASSQLARLFFLYPECIIQESCRTVRLHTNPHRAFLSQQRLDVY